MLLRENRERRDEKGAGGGGIASDVAGKVCSGARNEREVGTAMDDDGEEMVEHASRRRWNRVVGKKRRGRAMFLGDWSSVDRRSGWSFVVPASCLESKHVRVLRRTDGNRYLDRPSGERKELLRQDLCLLRKNLSLAECPRASDVLEAFSFN